MTLPEIGESERALVVRAEEAAGNLPVALRSQTDYELASQRLVSLKAVAKEIEDGRQDWVVGPTRDLKTRWEKWFGNGTRLVAAGIERVDNLMKAYRAEQEAIRQAEERRLRAIEEERAAKERAKLEAEARRKREAEEELRRKADEARRKAEADAEAARQRLLAAAAKTKDAAKKRELKAEARSVTVDATAAEKLDAKADAKRTESFAAEQQAKNTVASEVTVESRVAPVEGVTIRKVWKFRVVDFKSLPDTYKLANEVMLGSIARSDKAAAKVPGVEFYSESVLAARGS
jgi:DNA polymerase III gamma/tau subunit